MSLSLDAIRAQFDFVRSAPPLLQQALGLASPVQIALTVEAADFGASVPLKVTARIFVQGLGQGIPEIPLSFAIDGSAVKSNVFSDKNGQAAFSATLTKSGTYNLRVFAGPVDANNPAYGEQDITVAGISVTSSGLPSVGFSAEQKSFSAPATLLFPFYAGGPAGYTLTFSPVVNRGTNNAWLLMAPSQYSVTARDDSVNLPYVLPTLSISTPESVLDEEPLTISAKITDQVGNPLPYQAVLLEFADGTEITSLTADASGNVSYTTSLEEGTYAMKASWEDLNYSHPTDVEVILPRLAVQAPGNVQPNQSFAYSATSRTKSGGAIANLPLAVSVDGGFVKNVSTDGSGQFSDSLSFPSEGSHTISVAWKSLAQAAATVVAKNVQAAQPPVPPTTTTTAPQQTVFQLTPGQKVKIPRSVNNMGLQLHADGYVVMNVGAPYFSEVLIIGGIGRTVTKGGLGTAYSDANQTAIVGTGVKYKVVDSNVQDALGNEIFVAQDVGNDGSVYVTCAVDGNYLALTFQDSLGNVLYTTPNIRPGDEYDTQGRYWSWGGSISVNVIDMDQYAAYIAANGFLDLGRDASTASWGGYKVVAGTIQFVLPSPALQISGTSHNVQVKFFDKTTGAPLSAVKNPLAFGFSSGGETSFQYQLTNGLGYYDIAGPGTIYAFVGGLAGTYSAYTPNTIISNTVTI